MTDKGVRPRAVAMMTRAMIWAYDRATASLPGLGSAAEVADSHLKAADCIPEKAIDRLVAWQVAYAGAAGFATNLGGLPALPITLPANLSSVLLIQLRLIAAIAHLRGYDITDERVRTMAFICLTGSSAAGILEELSVDFGIRMSNRLLGQVSGTALARINHLVGFRLVARTGGGGLINLAKFVPVVGGLFGGAFDAAMTRGIALAARKVFPPVEREMKLVEQQIP